MSSRQIIKRMHRSIKTGWGINHENSIDNCGGDSTDGGRRMAGVLDGEKHRDEGFVGST
jgi:hypothetical protein